MTDGEVQVQVLSQKEPNPELLLENKKEGDNSTNVNVNSQNKKSDENSAPLAPRKKNNRNGKKSIMSNDDSQGKGEKEQQEPNVPVKTVLDGSENVSGITTGDINKKRKKEGNEEIPTKLTTTTDSIATTTTTTPTLTTENPTTERQNQKKRNQNRKDKPQLSKSKKDIKEDSQKGSEETSSTNVTVGAPLEKKDQTDRTLVNGNEQNTNESKNDKKKQKKRNRSNRNNGDADATKNDSSNTTSTTNTSTLTPSPNDVTTNSTAKSRSNLRQNEENKGTKKDNKKSSSSPEDVTNENKPAGSSLTNIPPNLSTESMSSKNRQRKRKDKKKTVNNDVNDNNGSSNQETVEEKTLNVKQEIKEDKKGGKQKKGKGGNGLGENRSTVNQKANTNTTSIEKTPEFIETPQNLKSNDKKKNRNSNNSKAKENRNIDDKNSGATSIAVSTINPTTNKVSHTNKKSNNTRSNTNNSNKYQNNATSSNYGNINQRTFKDTGPLSSSYGSSIISVNRDESIMKEKNYYYDHVMIPSKFEGWIRNSLEECNTILAQVKETSNARSIIIEQHVGDSEVEYRFTVSAFEKDACKQAIALLEFHLKNQEYIMRKRDNISRINNDISIVQEKLAAGLRIEFNIDRNLTGLAIGKKGEYITKVKNVTGVDVIDINDGNIRIAGPDIDSVNHARSMIEIMSTDLPLTYDLMQPLLLRHIPDIKAKSECLQVRVINISSQSEENPQGIYVREGQIVGLKNGRYESTDEVALVRLIGTKAQVDSAKKLLDTQIDYIHRLAEIQLNETEARKRRREVHVGDGRNKNITNGKK